MDIDTFESGIRAAVALLPGFRLSEFGAPDDGGCRCYECTAGRAAVHTVFIVGPNAVIETPSNRYEWGPVHIKLNLGQGESYYYDVRIYVDVYGCEYHHPHVLDSLDDNEPGLLCAGSWGEQVVSAMERQDWVRAIALSHSAACAYNPKDSYHRLPDEPYLTCTECDRVYDEDELSSCAGCDELVCKDCSRFSVAEEDYFCGGCVKWCGHCKDFRLQTSECESCSSTVCEDCSEHDLCPTCLAESERCVSCGYPFLYDSKQCEICDSDLCESCERTECIECGKSRKHGMFTSVCKTCNPEPICNLCWGYCETCGEANQHTHIWFARCKCGRVVCPTHLVLCQECGSPTGCSACAGLYYCNTCAEATAIEAGQLSLFSREAMYVNVT